MPTTVQLPRWPDATRAQRATLIQADREQRVALDALARIERTAGAEAEQLAQVARELPAFQRLSAAAQARVLAAVERSVAATVAQRQAAIDRARAGLSPRGSALAALGSGAAEPGVGSLPARPVRPLPPVAREPLPSSAARAGRAPGRARRPQRGPTALLRSQLQHRLPIRQNA